MSKLKVFGLEENVEWDNIVRSFQEYDTYWLSGYVKAFYIHGDGVPLLLFYQKDKTRAINVVMKRDVAKAECFSGKIAEGNFFDFATPYGYGGWLIEGENKDDVFMCYRNWLEKNGIISEFVRFHPIIKNHSYCSNFYHIQALGEVIHMDLTSADVIWNNYISQNRNKIRKAIKNDVRIYNGRNPEIFKEFKKIYNQTMDRDNAEKYYYFEDEFYKSILDDLPQNAQIFYAVKEGMVIAASIMLIANGKINYHLSGSLKDYNNIAPINLLLHETALWGHENGFKTFYLGGGVGSEEDSLFVFKRGFNRGEINHFYIGKKIYDEEKYNFLLKLRNGVSSSFFPEYRA